MKNIRAFTLVELIVSISILTILASISFISYTNHISNARDSQRKSDLSQISSALNLQKVSRGYFPEPGNAFNIVYDTSNIVAKQGFFDTNIRIIGLDELNYDPKINIPYTYSITNNNQEFQIATTLESDERLESLVVGNYKTVSRNILPSIVLAIKEDAGNNVEIKDGIGDGSTNINKFIFSEQNHNLIYTFQEPYEPYTDGISLSDLINELEVEGNFWQSSDYRNCLEIQEAGKLIIPLDPSTFEYQIVSSTGALTNTGCTE